LFSYVDPARLCAPWLAILRRYALHAHRIFLARPSYRRPRIIDQWSLTRRWDRLYFAFGVGIESRTWRTIVHAACRNLRPLVITEVVRGGPAMAVPRPLLLLFSEAAREMAEPSTLQPSLSDELAFERWSSDVSARRQTPSTRCVISLELDLDVRPPRLATIDLQRLGTFYLDHDEPGQDLELSRVTPRNDLSCGKDRSRFDASQEKNTEARFSADRCHHPQSGHPCKQGGLRSQ